MLLVPEPRAGKSEGSRLAWLGWPQGEAVEARSKTWMEAEVYGFVDDGREDSWTCENA